METFVYDPNIFIRPPYIRCPFCKEFDCFGVLNIGGNEYERKCKRCKKNALYSLPPLHKKIIYIDQYALSKMMKVLHPDSRETADPFWKTLFGRLDRLCKLQLIICPMSSVHEQESRMTKHFKKIERLNYQLSNGLSFKDAHTITLIQVLLFVSNWIDGKDIQTIKLDRNEVFKGPVDEWQSRIIKKVTLPDIPIWADGLRKVQKETEKDFHEVLKRRWVQQQGKTTKAFFKEVLEEEARAFGEVMLKLAKNYYGKLIAINLGKRKPAIEDFQMTPAAVLMESLAELFRIKGFQEREIAEQIIKCLTSTVITEIPCIKISSALHAAVARKYCAGQRIPPKPKPPSILNDITAISTVLPYCDAIMVDNLCREFLCESSVKEEVPYALKVFSTSNRVEFIDYLDEIEKQASSQHLEIVKEVYGEDWEEPFYKLFDKENGKQ